MGQSVGRIDILEEGRRVLRLEAEAVRLQAECLDESFARAVELLEACSHRVVLTGVGKSGLIARKIGATLASTGTPAIFMHAAEGVHGDLGMITPQDVVVALSYSGKTEEVVRLLPYISYHKIPLIVMTRDEKSVLAKNADVVLRVQVDQEACPLGLAPTTSSTVMLALGDALAMAVLKRKGFKPEEFAVFHPQGSLGKRLLTRVGDLMHGGEANPVIRQEVSFKEAIIEMSSKSLGATSIVDDKGCLAGILTDGDIRRILLRDGATMETPVREVMIRNPKRTTADALGVKALDLMEQKKITVLPVVDDQDHPIAMIHIHDLIMAGITP